MKKASFYFVLAAAFLFSAASCSSNDDNSSNSSTDPAQVTATVTQGTWRITSFVEDGTDHTSDFTGYNFTFGSNGALTAANGTDTVDGFWTVTSDDGSDDDNSTGDSDFNIIFSTPASFAELTEDWDVIERTSSRIKLRHISGGDGSTDTVTLEKNS